MCGVIRRVVEFSAQSGQAVLVSLLWVNFLTQREPLNSKGMVMSNVKFKNMAMLVLLYA